MPAVMNYVNILVSTVTGGGILPSGAAWLGAALLFMGFLLVCAQVALHDMKD